MIINNREELYNVKVGDILKITSKLEHPYGVNEMLFRIISIEENYYEDKRRPRILALCVLDNDPTDLNFMGSMDDVANKNIFSEENWIIELVEYKED